MIENKEPAAIPRQRQTRRFIVSNSSIRESLEWQELAECDGYDQRIFFAEDGERSKDWSEAKEICGRCPVIEDCLNDALKAGSRAEYGVWGGLTEDERKHVKKLRKQKKLTEALEFIVDVHAESSKDAVSYL